MQRLPTTSVFDDFGLISDYGKLAAGAFWDEVLGRRVSFFSLDDLLAIKEAAGRSQDLADLEYLRALHG